MKSYAITALAFAGLAWGGAFFEFWSLPGQAADHLTAKDAGRKLGALLDFTDDLRQIRDGYREKNEAAFSKEK